MDRHPLTNTMRSFRPIEYSKYFSLKHNPFLHRKWGAGIGYIKNFGELVTWWMHKYLKGLPPLNHDKIRPGSIPILLNNFNRLDSLRSILGWIQSLDGEKSIIILDNHSSYKPLLEFYDQLNHPQIQVIRLGLNSYPICIRHYKKQLKRFPRIIVSDCDLEPYPDTPKDILQRLSAILDKYPDFSHAGVSLNIDDIPNHYPLKNLVTQWEKRFWPPLAPLIEEGVCIADVDTTFAIWRSEAPLDALSPALRLLPPYTLKHIDWYVHPEEIPQEYRYYINQCSPYATWTKELHRALKI